MKTISVLTLLLLASACSLPAGGLDGGAIAGLECGRTLAGEMQPADGCYEAVGDGGCAIVLPGDECGAGWDWYPGGVRYEVWCAAWVPAGTPVRLVAVSCR